jgi:hypothetical protein
MRSELGFRGSGGEAPHGNFLCGPEPIAAGRASQLGGEPGERAGRLTCFWCSVVFCSNLDLQIAVATTGTGGCGGGTEVSDVLDC